MEENEETKRANAKKIEEIRYFLSSNDSYFSQDLRDFRRGQNIAAGSGPFSRVGRAWGEARSSMTFNAMRKSIDSTCNAFLREPFRFEGASDDVNSRITQTLYECLREACETGLSYFYIVHKPDGSLKFKRIPCTDCIWTESEALAIKKEKAKQGEYARNTIWTGLSSVQPKHDEAIVITWFKHIKETGMVEIVKVKDDKVADTTSIPLSRLPIIQVRCKSNVLSDNEVHYRGFYYEFEDLLNGINLNLSVSAERMIVPNPWFLAEESIGDDEMRKQFETTEPRPFYTYQSKMEVVENDATHMIDLPQPVPAPQSMDLPALNEQLRVFLSIIDGQTGMDIASENKGAETATAVLARNRAKEDALSEMLYHLNTSAKAIADVLMSYAALTGEPAQITVQDSMSESMRNKTCAEMVLAMQNLSPVVQGAILEVFDAPDLLKQAVAQVAAQAGDPEKQALAQQLQQAQMELLLLKTENKMAEATYQSALAQAEARMNVSALEIQSKERLAMIEYNYKWAELQLKYSELGLEAEAEAVKNEIEANKQALEQGKAEAEIALKASKQENDRLTAERKQSLAELKAGADIAQAAGAETIVSIV